MLAKRKKLSKREMKEDKLVTYYYKAKDFAIEYQAKLLIGIGILIVLVVAIVLMNQNSEKNNLKANALLSKVIPVFISNQYEQAIDGIKSDGITGLKQIVSDYGSTNAGEIAKLYLAKAYFYVRDYDNAMKYFKDFSGVGDIYKAAAYAGIAGCYEVKKDYSEAASYYKKAFSVAKDNANNPEYMLKAGINYVNDGKNDDARELFIKIKEDYKNTTAAYNIDRYMAMTGGNN